MRLCVRVVMAGGSSLDQTACVCVCVCICMCLYVSVCMYVGMCGWSLFGVCPTVCVDVVMAGAVVQVR